MPMCDWSSDVCSSDLHRAVPSSLLSVPGHFSPVRRNSTLVSGHSTAPLLPRPWQPPIYFLSPWVCLPSIRVFSNESALCIRWPKYWSFSFNISPSNKHPGLISFRMDWLDLLAIQGTLKSLLQHYSSKASILRDYSLICEALCWYHMPALSLP